MADLVANGFSILEVQIITKMNDSNRNVCCLFFQKMELNFTNSQDKSIKAQQPKLLF